MTVGKNLNGAFVLFEPGATNDKDGLMYFFFILSRTDFFAGALQIEKELGIPISHETHRRRFMFTPWNTAEVVKKFPLIKITADISHWMCVLSNTMDAHMDLIRAIAPNVYHIHGRVGYDNGPQVPDPRAPEWTSWVEAHERCWDIFWKQRASDGADAMYFEPEYGPPPYCQTLPWTGVAVVNIHDVAEWQTSRAVERFSRMFPSQ